MLFIIFLTICWLKPLLIDMLKLAGFMPESNLFMHELGNLLYHTNKSTDKMPSLSNIKKGNPVFTWLPLSLDFY